MTRIDLTACQGSAVAIELLKVIGGKNGYFTASCRSETQAELVERVVARAHERRLTDATVIIEIAKEEKDASGKV